MNELLKVLLSLSLSASLIAGLLLALRPVLKNRLSKAWQYYIWLVVILRLLIPVTPEISLVNHLFHRAEAWSAAESREPAPQGESLTQNSQPPSETADISPLAPVVPVEQEASGNSPQLRDSFWLLWLGVAVVLLVRKVTSYHGFVRFIRAGWKPVESIQILDGYGQVCRETGIRRVPPLYQNPLASSPMLVGILRPTIVLPTLELESQELLLILRHELVHCRRWDILYKWLVQITLCLHWFNPLVYWVAREVDKSCELSCDAAVLRNLDAQVQKKYGDTLLAAVKTGGGYGDTVASVTLSEEGKLLKERLASILHFIPGSRRTRMAAAALTVVLVGGAAFAGAYVGAGATAAAPTVAPEESAVGTSETGLPLAAASLRDEGEVVRITEGQYVHLLTPLPGQPVSRDFDTDSPHTVFYVLADYDGDYAITITHRETGEVVSTKSGVRFLTGSEPVFVMSLGAGSFQARIEVSSGGGPGSVEVYAAGVEQAGAAGNIPKPAKSRASYNTASTGQSFTITAENKVTQYRQYHYGNGYIFLLNWSSTGSAEDFPSSVHLPTQVCFTGQTAAFAQDDAFLSGLESALQRMQNRFPLMNFDEGGILSVPEAEGPFQETPDELLRRFYSEDNTSHFSAVLSAASGEAIQQLFRETLDKKQNTYSSMLAGALPPDSDFDAYAREAYQKGLTGILSILVEQTSLPVRQELFQMAWDSGEMGMVAVLIDEIPGLDYHDLAQQAYDSEKINLFSYVEDELNAQQRSAFALRAYEDERINFFSILSDGLSAQQRGELALRAYADQRINFFSVLSDELNAEQRNQLAIQSYNDDRINFFSVLSDELNTQQRGELAIQAYNDGRINFFSMLSDDLNSQQRKELALQAYDDEQINFFSILSDELSAQDREELLQRAMTDKRMSFISVLLD